MHRILYLMAWFLVFQGTLLCSVATAAEEPPPEVKKVEPVAPPRNIVFPKRGSFYLTIMSPYPATFGLGMTHYLGNYLGLTVNFGKGDIITFAGGLLFRPAAGKLSPIVGMMISRGTESKISATTTEVSAKGFAYVTSGFDWKWDSGPLLHIGINWTLTPFDGQTAMKPFLQFGFPY